MSVTPSSTIVGVFRDQSAAEQAANALYNAGFEQEQIQYMVPGTSGSFFEGLKSFLTGTNEGGGNLSDELTRMGLSDSDAQFYANEYNNGNPILIVRAAERGTEAMNVLRQYGAYKMQTEPVYSGEAAGDTQQPAAYTQQDSATVDTQSSSDYTESTGYGAPGQHDNVQDLETQPQPHTDEEHPYAAVQPGNATPEYDLSDQDTLIITPPNDTNMQDVDTQARDMQADTTTPAPVYDTDNSVSGTDTVAREQDSETPASPLPSAAPQEYGVYQDAGSSETASETDTYTTADYQAAQTTEVVSEPDTNDQGFQSDLVGYETDPQNGQTGFSDPVTGIADQATQADTTTPEQDYGYDTDQATASTMTGYGSPPPQTTPAPASQDTAMQPELTGAASPEQTDELQQLQAELQTLQQQLQEAKARLAEAKEQENQLRTAREREQQLQSARQQMQDIQAELQATLAEYQEVQSRIGQYQ